MSIKYTLYSEALVQTKECKILLNNVWVGFMLKQ